MFGEEAVTFHMLHNMISNDGFHSLACNAGEANKLLDKLLDPFFCVLVLFWLVSMTQVGRPPPAISGILGAVEHLGRRIVL